MHTYAAPPRVKCSNTARAKLPRALPVCAQFNMVLGGITNTASTAASKARASSKEHSKEMEDGDNSCDINSCDSSRENSCEGWCADAALAAAAALAATALAATAPLVCRRLC